MSEPAPGAHAVEKTPELRGRKVGEPNVVGQRVGAGSLHRTVDEAGVVPAAAGRDFAHFGGDAVDECYVCRVTRDVAATPAGPPASST